MQILHTYVAIVAHYDFFFDLLELRIRNLIFQLIIAILQILCVPPNFLSDPATRSLITVVTLNRP